MKQEAIKVYKPMALDLKHDLKHCLAANYIVATT